MLKNRTSIKSYQIKRYKIILLLTSTKVYCTMGLSIFEKFGYILKRKKVRIMKEIASSSFGGYPKKIEGKWQFAGTGHTLHMYDQQIIERDGDIIHVAWDGWEEVLEKSLD